MSGKRRYVRSTRDRDRLDTLGLEPEVGLPGIDDSPGDNLLLGGKTLLPTTGVSLEIDELVPIEVIDEGVSGELGVDLLAIALWQSVL